MDTVSEKEFRTVQRMLQTENQLAFRIASGSMEPLIMTGEEIIVATLETTPKRYDILVYWNGKVLICHYLWHINQLPGLDGLPVYVTRPLLYLSDDYPVSQSQLLGIVVSHRLTFLNKLKIFMKVFFDRNRRGILEK